MFPCVASSKSRKSVNTWGRGLPIDWAYFFIAFRLKIVKTREHVNTRDVKLGNSQHKRTWIVIIFLYKNHVLKCFLLFYEDYSKNLTIRALIIIVYLGQLWNRLEFDQLTRAFVENYLQKWPARAVFGGPHRYPKYFVSISI